MQPVCPATAWPRRQGRQEGGKEVQRGRLGTREGKGRRINEGKGRRREAGKAGLEGRTQKLRERRLGGLGERSSLAELFLCN